MTQNLNHYEKILSRSHSNYLAQISIEMTDANNQINDVLSKLTALGTVLIPMNLVTGLWGMNVNVPGETANVRVWFLYVFFYPLIYSTGLCVVWWDHRGASRICTHWWYPHIQVNASLDHYSFSLVLVSYLEH